MTLAEAALAVLEGNDTGEFVKPSRRLYPWQWNWDSAFVVIGLAASPRSGRGPRFARFSGASGPTG